MANGFAGEIDAPPPAPAVPIVLPRLGAWQAAFFPILLPSFNELEAARGRSWQAGRGQQNAYNIVKRKLQGDVMLFARRLLRPVAGQVVVLIDWREPTRYRDPDGIAAGGKKILMDAIGPDRKGCRGWHGAGILHCDGHHCVAGFVDVYSFDAGAPGVSVVLAEVAR